MKKTQGGMLPWKHTIGSWRSFLCRGNIRILDKNYPPRHR